MKLSASFLALSFAALLSAAPPSALAQTSAKPIAGTWQGTATARGGAQIPITIRITGTGSALHLALLNGPAAHPDEAPASSVTFDGSHLVAPFDYFAGKLDATLSGDTLSGTYGRTSTSTRGAPTPFTVTRVARAADPAASPNPPDIHGSWEIATITSKGDPATWELRIDPPTPGTPVLKAAIQRIDGDTGGLWGVWNGTSYNVGHFIPAGTALYSVTPQPDGTLVVKNLIPPAPKTKTSTDTAKAPTVPLPTEFIARRPDDARAHSLNKPTDPTRYTYMKDPAQPLAFSFPDLSGRTIANTDPQFHGKVVIVAIGGSWCPNCHDEAPLLVSLYNKFHARGLEIVGLDFEQGDPDTDTPRLKAFIAHYKIPYPMLVSGTTDQLNEKLPGVVNLAYWPTSFFIGRDGRVREIHDGFAGPGNTAGHIALEKETTELVEKLLAEPASKQSATTLQP